MDDATLTGTVRLQFGAFFLHITVRLEASFSVSPDTWEYWWTTLYIGILLDIVNLQESFTLLYTAVVVVIVSFLDLVFLLDIGLVLVNTIFLRGFVSIQHYAQGSVLV